jgi:beta-galactosidase
LWTLEAPRLYTLRSRLSVDSTVVDETTTPFGIRTLRFDAEKGFFLNDKSVKLKGVCIHHEAGGVGAAVPDKVLERRLRLLKELGVNAIRTSHNPPAPELLDMCDRLGLLVKDEAFDEFTPAKNKWVTGRNDGQPARFGYSEDFTEWSVRDAQDMVRRDRNHPSIIMWSIGNEIDYANDPFSHPVLGREYKPENPRAENMVKYARPLMAGVKELDRTRPVTMALATVDMSDAVGLGELLDIVGYNYQESRYPSDHAKYPKRFIYGSETSQQYADWVAARDNDYVGGQFLWTGIDYLGEANRWPNRGSSAGLLDVCGFKKPLAWFRQSLWSEQPMVYLATSSSGGGDSGRRGRMRGEESWNWTSNTTANIQCYTTCPEVQLMLNGRLIGTKNRADAVGGALRWEIPFEPGTLKAVGMQGDKQVCEFVLKTASTPSRIELLADVTQLAADGRDICHVEYRVVDAQGVRVPDAGNEVTFELSGPGEILCLENADLNSPESYKGKTHKAYQGHGLAILQSTLAAGTVTLKAGAPGLEPATLVLSSH